MEPQTRLGLAELTRCAFEGGDLASLKMELLGRCQGGPGQASAMMDLSVIEQLQGNLAYGLEWQLKALAQCRLFRTLRTAKHGGSHTKRLLVFAAPIHMGGNTPVEFLLPSGPFEILTLYPNAEDIGALPEFDVAFCAAPADEVFADAFFAQVRALTRGTGKPVLNLPDNLVKPERDTLPQLFRNVPGLHIPKTLRLHREDLIEALGSEVETGLLDLIGGYPVVIRPVGSHAGLGLARLGDPGDLITYLAARGEAEFFVGEYIDYASASDGQFRKYRIVLVDGQPLPCHMAISDQWDVWYMNAKMTEAPDKRREEAAFMDRFACDFAERHKGAFEALWCGIGFDYFGLDCAEDAAGNLVVFEVDNALIVHDMDCRATFPYKQTHMRAVFSSFEAMLLHRCAAEEGLQMNRIAPRKQLQMSEPAVFY